MIIGVVTDRIAQKRPYTYGTLAKKLLRKRKEPQRFLTPQLLRSMLTQKL